MKLSDIKNRLQLIWHGVNDHTNLESFLKSDIYWAEGDLRGHEEGLLVLRHDPWDTHPLRPGEGLLDFRHWLKAAHEAGKGIQIDLKEGGSTMDRMIDLLKEFRVTESRLWFTTNLKDVALDDYGRLGRTFPGARLQSAVPLRFMFQAMTADERHSWLEINRSLGARYVSISWYDEPTRAELEEIRQAGFGINLFYVNTLEDIRKALSLEPDSITSDFHIPEWDLFGRGSGENGYYLEKA